MPDEQKYVPHPRASSVFFPGTMKMNGRKMKARKSRRFTSKEEAGEDYNWWVDGDLTPEEISPRRVAHVYRHDDIPIRRRRRGNE